MKNTNIYLKLTTRALTSLRKSALRSFLTLLGVFIGSATIILVIEIGKGAQADIEKQYSNMSVNTILINAPSAEGGISSLGISDIQGLKEIPEIKDIAPQLTGRLPITYIETTVPLNIFGTTSNTENLVNLKMREGRFFSDEDSEKKNKVVVLGYTSAQELFGDDFGNIVGEKITINRKQYEVIGVAEYKGGSFGPVTIDDSIFVPYDVANRYILGDSGRFNINVIVTDFKDLPLAQEKIAEKLRELHNIKGNKPEDFRIRDMGSLVNSAQSSARTMSVLLWTVGTIVLIVGGIGIMNVMYTSVLERTKEVGIYKALGAKESHILFMFLIEALILSVLGFVVGSLTSTILYLLVSKTGFSIIFTPYAYVLSFLFTIIIGLAFGYYPAKKAAQLNVVDALRYE